MYFTSLVSVLPLLASISSAAPHTKRTVTTDVTLYAYGTNITGVALYYGNTDGSSPNAPDIQLIVLTKSRTCIHRLRPSIQLLFPNYGRRQHGRCRLERDCRQHH